MLQLKTLGGLSVEQAGAPCGGAASRRKTLALLALLAAAGKKGISRDKLVVHLWPESDTAHSRDLLKQACYALRRDLRQAELFLGTNDLRLNSAVISSDVDAFEEALEHGDSARSLARSVPAARNGRRAGCRRAGVGQAAVRGGSAGRVLARRRRAAAQAARIYHRFPDGGAADSATA